MDIREKFNHVLKVSSWRNGSLLHTATDAASLALIRASEDVSGILVGYRKRLLLLSSMGVRVV